VVNDPAAGGHAAEATITAGSLRSLSAFDSAPLRQA
jgi:hypothetical protein